MKASLPTPDRIFLKSPDNESYSVDKKDLDSALAEGFRVEDEKEKIVREYVKENDNIGGAAKVFLGQFVDESLMSIPELIYDTKADPLDKAKKDALKSHFDLANTLGGVGGFGTSLIIGAPLFKAAGIAGKGAAKLLPETGNVINKIASSGIKAAVEGTIISAPYAITEAALGKTEDAVEHILLGMGIGGALGLGGSAISEVGKSLIGAWGNSSLPIIKNLIPKEQDAAAKVLSLNPTQVNKIRTRTPDVWEELPSYLRNISKNDIKVLVDKEKMLEAVQNSSKASADALGTTLKQLDDSVLSALQNADDVTKKALESNSYSISRLKKEIREDLAENAFKNKEIVDFADDAVYKMNLESNLKDPRFRKDLEKLEEALEDYTEYSVSNGDKFFSPLELDAFRKRTDEILRNNKVFKKLPENRTMVDEVHLAARSKIQNYLRNEYAPFIEKTMPQLAGTAKMLKEASKQYHIAATIEPHIIRGLDKEAARSYLTFTDSLGAIIGTTAGGMPGGIGGWLMARGLHTMKDRIPAVTLRYGELFQKKIAEKLDTIPTLLKDTKLSKDTLNILEMGTLDRRFSRLLGLDSLGLEASPGFASDEGSEFEKLQNRIAELNTSPEILQKNLSKTSVLFVEGGAPELANMLSAKTADVYNYVSNMLPKPITPSSDLLKKSPFIPSDFEMAKFKRKLDVVLNPFQVLVDMKEGSLGADQVEVVKTLYPRLYDQMKTRIVNHLSENPLDISYNERLKYSLLLEVDLDVSTKPEYINAFQNTYIQKRETQNNSDFHMNNKRLKTQASKLSE